MAHQNHNIPWNTLAQNLTFHFKYPRRNDISDLYLRNRPNQAKQIDHFIRVFVDLLREFSRAEEARYSPRELLNADDVLIDDKTAQRIQPTVQKWRGERSWQPNSFKDSRRLSQDERLMSAFCGKKCDDLHCYVVDACNNKLELIKTLLYYNEVDILLKIVAHPEFKPSWSWYCCMPVPIGLQALVRITLLSYICLNIFYTMPHLYDPTSRRQYLDRTGQSISESQLDYRLAKAYQLMLILCTSDYPLGTQTYPHRQFYGILPHTFESIYDLGEKQLGRTSVAMLQDEKLRRIHVPHTDDIPTVRSYLRYKGLPTEICLAIMEQAEYVAQRRVPVANDPLHPENAEELLRYLKFCWRVLIACDMTMSAAGEPIDWEDEVKSCIWRLIGRTVKEGQSLLGENLYYSNYS